MYTRWPVFLIPAVILIAIATSEFSAGASEARIPQARSIEGRSAWGGTYTAAQATRGKAQYEARCGSCHGADLSGGIGQALKGDVFLRGWNGYPLGSLFGRIKATMPENAPSSLSDDAYLEIVAYLLQANSFPIGMGDLRTDDVENIRIEARDGPQPVPNYALVRVVGCLTQGSDNAWTLSSASEPVRTRNPEPSKDEELKNSIGKAPGPQQYRLMNIYPNPDSYKGHKIEVKGFLIKAPNEHINVNALQTLASSCDKSALLIELPDGDGKIVLERACTTCHDLEGLKDFKGYYTEERWRDLVIDMVKAGAQLKGEEITIVARYLAKYFGPENR